MTYSNEAKQRLLNVPPELVAGHGAVSGPVAMAMVRGLVLASRVPLAVSVTGVAGPGGGTPEKPVGTVWFGLSATRKETMITAVEVRFSGSRGRIQSAVALFARTLVRRWWESGMHLDSLRSVPDNEGKSRIVAFQPPLPLLFDPL